MRFTALSLCLIASSVAAFSPVATTPNVRLSSALNMAEGEFDFDVAIIGCGVGGHGAALHSRAQDLKTAVFAGSDIGGTCVNRGCVPSKALLAASGRVREMKDAEHLSAMGIKVAGEVEYDRQGIADHAKNLASNVKRGLEGSLVGLGCDIIEGRGILTGNPHEIKDSLTGKVYTAKVRQASLHRLHIGSFLKEQADTCFLHNSSVCCLTFVILVGCTNVGHYLGPWLHPICSTRCPS